MFMQRSVERSQHRRHKETQSYYMSADHLGRVIFTGQNPTVYSTVHNPHLLPWTKFLFTSMLKYILKFRCI